MTEFEDIPHTGGKVIFSNGLSTNGTKLTNNKINQQVN